MISCQYNFGGARKLFPIRGFTIIELITAVAISSVLILGIVSVYSTTKRANTLQNEYGKLQENARFAMQLLTHDIRGAGFSGCVPHIRSFLDTNSGSYDSSLIPLASGVTGWNFNGTDPNQSYTITSLSPTSVAVGSWTSPSKTGLPASLAGKVVPGSDVLTLVQSQTMPGVQLNGSVTPLTSANISVTVSPNAPPITAGQIIMVGNCDQSDVFQTTTTVNSGQTSVLTRGVASGKISPGNIPSASWTKSYVPTSTDFVTINPLAYYIGTGASGQPSLFRMDYSQSFAGTPMELVEGVENMQILYGVDTTSASLQDYIPDQYVTANNVANPNRIVSVRISLLIRTPREIASRPLNTTNYQLGGAQVSTSTQVIPNPPAKGGDKFSRKVYTTTIYMRNMATYRNLTQG